MRTNFILLAAVFLLAFSGCRENKNKELPAPSVAAPPVEKAAAQAPVPPRPPGCAACHADIKPDERHNFACTDCHDGNNETNDKALAHKDLTASPAEPAKMEAVCGRCHAGRDKACAGSAHFTLQNEVSLVRSHFGLAPVGSLTDIPDRSGLPENKEQLIDDLLRRRCLRCHLHTKGDSYPAVRRGKGCAACHLRYADGKLQSHAFVLPGEDQCLRCHYGNYVGSDFFGRYEHDFNDDYRTPYAPSARLYGVEQHDLVPDIHQQRGLTCLDCHRSRKTVTCRDCHAPGSQPPPLNTIRTEGNQLILTAVKDGREHLVPALRHPAHAKYADKADCQVCHAQWSFNDQTAHLLLSYSAEVRPWRFLAVQSSSEAENFILKKSGREPAMTDSLTGKTKPGIWYQGYTLRRWENLLIRQDKDGVLKIFRPILDLRLSAADKDGRVIAGLDSIAGTGSGLLPYTPHTTGPAGLFYEQRFLNLLGNQEEKLQ